MENPTNKLQAGEDTKKLSIAVLCLSVFVVAIFGLVPLA